MTENRTFPNGAAGPSRRGALALGLAGLCAAALQGVPALRPVGAAQAASDAAQKIADRFSGVATMTGEFVQFGPRGEQTGGKFFLQRPGRMRFVYEAPADVHVIADGKSVLIDNRRMKTMTLYPLSKTPLKLLLDERIDLTDGKVKSVREEPDATTIQLADKNLFGSSKISMIFDPQSYDLKQWTITDNQGKDTTVMIYNVQQGVTFGKDVFKIDYVKVNAQTEQRGDN